MRLRAEKMAPYTVTEADVLWLARAVEAEGAIQSQVAATLVNGFCFQRSRGQSRDLATFVRAYAQPCNPRWYPLGDLYLRDIEGKTPSELKQATAAAERRAAVHSARTTFSAGTREAVIAALNGRAVIPPTATDYAAPEIDATGKGYTPLVPPIAGRNRLWARPGAETWAGYVVDATDAWPWLVGVVLLGFAAWRWWVV
jgi:hypothetical protein